MKEIIHTEDKIIYKSDLTGEPLGNKFIGADVTVIETSPTLEGLPPANSHYKHFKDLKELIKYITEQYGKTDEER